MATFITLTYSGRPFRYNVAHIVSYWAHPEGGSCVSTTNAETNSDADRVSETPEQIDAMLGVTESPAETYRKALEQIAEPVDFATCIGDPWDFYRDLQAVARDAIAAARGE